MREHVLPTTTSLIRKTISELSRQFTAGEVSNYLEIVYRRPISRNDATAILHDEMKAGRVLRISRGWYANPSVARRLAAEPAPEPRDKRVYQRRAGHPYGRRRTAKRVSRMLAALESQPPIIRVPREGTLSPCPGTVTKL